MALVAIIFFSTKIEKWKQYSSLMTRSLSVLITLEGSSGKLTQKALGKVSGRVRLLPER